VPNLQKALLAVSLLAACASSIAPQLAQRRSLPQGHLGPLLDCAGDEASLCDPNQTDTEARCQALLEDEGTAFTGHRCLAWLAIERSRVMVSVETAKTKPEEAKPSELAQLEEVEQRRRAHERSFLQTAIGHLQQARALAPEELGLALHELQAYERLRDTAAMIELIEYLAQRSDEPELLWQLHGFGYRAAHSPLEAEALFSALLSARPDYVPALCDHATLLMRRDELELALPQLMRAVALQPDDALAAANAAEAALVLLDAKTMASLAQQSTAQDVPVLEEYRRLQSSPQQSAEHWLGRALEETSLKPLFALLSVMQAQASGGGPLSFRATLAQSEALEALGYGNRALAALLTAETVAAKGQGDVDLDTVRLVLVQALLRRAQHQEARAKLRLVKQDSAMRDYLEALLLLSEGQTEQAKAKLRALSLRPDAGDLARSARSLLDELKDAGDDLI
jgi:hypothetical protein